MHVSTRHYNHRARLSDRLTRTRFEKDSIMKIKNMLNRIYGAGSAELAPRGGCSK